MLHPVHREVLMAERDADKQLKVLSALMAIHHSIGANLELDEIGRILVKELALIVPCDGCAILLFDNKKVGILAERGFQIMLGGKDFTTDMPAIKHIIDTKQSIHTGDILKSPAASCVPVGCIMKSMICTPIIVEGEVRGIIHLDSRQGDAFSPEDLLFVELLAKEISLAVARSLQYAHVKALAVRDALTGCYNRWKFDEDLRSTLACCIRYRRPLSLLMIDIDWFKAYNDFHGHPKGDALLKKIADILSQTIRLCDKLYRYGGEEFVVLLQETDREGALLAAKRIHRFMEQQQFDGARESQPGKRITISVGVASFPDDGKEENILVAVADSALYKAKQTGRNRVCCGAGV